MTTPLEVRIEKNLRMTLDELMIQIGRSSPTAWGASPPSDDVAKSRFRTWFNETHSALKGRLCNPETQELLKALSTPYEVAIALMGAVADLCEGFDLTLVVAYLINLGIEHFCKNQ